MSRLTIEKEHSFSGHRDSLFTLAPAGREGMFFSAGGDGMVVQWQLDKPDTGVVLAKADASIYAMALDAEKGLLYFGQNYDGLRVVETSSKKDRGSLQLTKAAIFALVLWNNKVLIGTGSGQLLVVQQDPLRLLQEFPLSTESLRSLSVHPDRQELAAGFSDNTIRILDLNTFATKQVIEAHQNSVFTVQYSPDGQYLLSGSRDAHIKVWTVGEPYEQANSIVAHLYAINHLSFSPDGSLFASCSMDKSVKLWDATTFKLLKVVDKVRHAGHGTSVNRLLWLDNRTLASASDDRTISIWKIAYQETY